MAERGLAISFVSLAVAAASAAFAGGTFFVSQQQLRQERNATLIAQRVQACVSIGLHAQEVTVSADQAGLMLELYGDQSDEFLRAMSAVNSAVVELHSVSTLDLLGPENLASAEMYTEIAASRVLSAVGPGEERNRASISLAAEELLKRRIELASACRATFGLFRDVR